MVLKNVELWSCSGTLSPSELKEKKSHHVGGAEAIAPAFERCVGPQGGGVNGKRYFYAESDQKYIEEYSLLRTLYEALKDICTGEGYHVRYTVCNRDIINAVQVGEYDEFARLGYLRNMDGERYEPPGFFTRCGDLIIKIEELKREHNVRLDFCYPAQDLCKKYSARLRERLLKYADTLDSHTEKLSD